METLIGHSDEYDLLSRWAAQPFPRYPPYYIITGPTGIGKKMLIKHALDGYDFTHFDSNTKKTNILEIFKTKTSMTTFGDFFKGFTKNAIIIEDVDKTLGDLKYYKEFIKLCSKCKCPVIMTCQKKKRIHKNVILLTPIDDKTLFSFFKKTNGISDTKMKFIIKKSRGDIRTLKNAIETISLDKKHNLEGICFKDSFLISGQAIKDILSHKYNISEKTQIIETDFQNISEILFYNIPKTAKFSKKTQLEDLQRLSGVYENVSFGDTLMKKIVTGHKHCLLGHFINVSCFSAIDNMYNVKKLNITKLSIPYVEYTFPRDVSSFLYTFIFLTVPIMMKEKKLVYIKGLCTLNRHLFVKLFRMTFKRILKKQEKEIVHALIEN
jgi:hypothetical protein